MALLRKFEAKRKTTLNASRKHTMGGFSHNEREMRKLECSANYDGNLGQENFVPGMSKSKRKVIKYFIRSQRARHVLFTRDQAQIYVKSWLDTFGFGRFWNVEFGIIMRWNYLGIEGAFSIQNASTTCFQI